jgi:hypothetical protein
MLDAERQISTYTKGNLRIADRRIFTKINNGGLGLFKINDFLMAQRCAWLRRIPALDEIWKIEFYGKSCGNLLRVSKKNFDPEINPILYCIAEAGEKLMTEHTKLFQNFRHAFVYENTALTIGVRGSALNRASWGPNFDVGRLAYYYGLRFVDIFIKMAILKTLSC